MASLVKLSKSFVIFVTIGAREGAFDNVITRIRSGWCKFKDLVPLLASRGLPLEAKGRLCSTFVRSVMLYEIET